MSFSFFKIVAVTNALVLTAAFIAYRSGVFQSSSFSSSTIAFTSSNGGNSVMSAKDSVLHKTDPNPFLRMVSSKSVVLADPYKKPPFVSLRQPDTFYFKKTTTIKHFLSSSKSGAVFDVNLFNINSIIKDTLIKPKK